MIIIDYSAIAVANIFVQNMQNDLSENLLRHMILNSVRMYNLRFKNDFGQIYIACDHRSWRKGIFPQYKANRSKGRDASPINWEEVYGWVEKIKKEIDQYSPYIVLHLRDAEADDIIATLVESTQEFGKNEPVKIISADKDFVQLQKYSNVSQFSPTLKKEIKDKDPTRYLFEHIIRGDSGDGIPNIFSDDDTFIVEGKRQAPVSKKKLEALYQSYLNGNIEFEKVEHKRNFDRNKKLIDLAEIPSDVKNTIIEAINEKQAIKQPNSNVFLNYLIQKKCSKLITNLTEFF